MSTSGVDQDLAHDSRHSLVSSYSLASTARSVYLSALDVQQYLLDSDMESETGSAAASSGGEEEVFFDCSDELTANALLSQHRFERTYDSGDDKNACQELELNADHVSVQSDRPADPFHALIQNLKETGHRIVKLADNYLLFAVQASDITCPEESPTEISKWLADKRGSKTNKIFIEGCFGENPKDVNAFRRRQSQIFLFLYMIVRDIIQLGHESVPRQTRAFTCQDKYLEWMGEIDNMFNILLNASFIHIQFSEMDAAKIEFPLLLLKTSAAAETANESRHSDEDQMKLDDSTKEATKARTKMTGMPSLIEKILTVVSMLIFVVDMGTDILQVVMYERENNRLWPVILAFIIGPSLLSTALCFHQLYLDEAVTKKEVTWKRIGVMFILLQLGAVWRGICILSGRHHMLDSYVILSLLLMKMFEGIFEGGPQTLVQTYMLLGRNVTQISLENILHVVSPILSSMSMAIAITDLDLGRVGLSLSLKVKILYILCRVGEVWGRFIVYVVIFYSFGAWGFFCILAQFLLLLIPTLIAMRLDHARMYSRRVNCVYLRCRYGGFTVQKPRKLFRSRGVRLIVWLAIPVLYSFVPLQRFELDMESNIHQTNRPPFWKCSREFSYFNILYAMHICFNVVGFVIWLTAGHATSHEFFIPMCVLFLLGTVVSLTFRIQSWVKRTYQIFSETTRTVYIP